MTKQVFEGVKVLDFGWATAGPMVTTFLGYTGAEVINIETRTKTSLTRASPPLRREKPTGETVPGSSLTAEAPAKGNYFELSHPRGLEVAKKTGAVGGRGC